MPQCKEYSPSIFKPPFAKHLELGFVLSKSPSLPAGSTREFFSDSHIENRMKFLEVKLRKVWLLLHDWVPLEFVVSQTCAH